MEISYEGVAGAFVTVVGLIVLQSFNVLKDRRQNRYAQEEWDRRRAEEREKEELRRAREEEDRVRQREEEEYREAQKQHARLDGAFARAIRCTASALTFYADWPDEAYYMRFGAEDEEAWEKEKYDSFMNTYIKELREALDHLMGVASYLPPEPISHEPSREQLTALRDDLMAKRPPVLGPPPKAGSA
ncbi:hypothetical protein ACFVUW_30145 [Streptomyces xiamenensis]|uniref:hypothetical protein n=1 Tax=Streptomyces xiamenensis TaxID=408015 RepID=UPI0036E36F96